MVMRWCWVCIRCSFNVGLWGCVIVNELIKKNIISEVVICSLKIIIGYLGVFLSGGIIIFMIVGNGKFVFKVWNLYLVWLLYNLLINNDFMIFV